MPAQLDSLLRRSLFAVCALALAALSACSGATSFSAGSSTSLPALVGPSTQANWYTDTFDPFQTATKTVTTPAPQSIDLLWVIDNSGSMQDKQVELIQGISTFVQSYLAPITSGAIIARDVRIAVITTDTWCAGNAGCIYYDQCNALNAAQYPLRYGYPADYSRLIPGIHDGTLPTVANASLGDAVPVGYVDPATGVVTCDQTTSHPRSGQPILSAATIQTQNDLNQFIANFQINANVGVFGSGSSRALQSIEQLLTDNESAALCSGPTPSPACFFRKGAARGILMMSDDCDHTGAPDPNASTTSWGCGGMTAVNGAKAQLDSFFKTLDGTNDPRYFALAITDPIGQEYQHLAFNVASDPSNSLGSWSNIESIDDPNYSTLLNGLGSSVTTTTPVTQLISLFTLSHAVSDSSLVTVTLVHSDGTQEIVDPSAYALVDSGSQTIVEMNASSLSQLVSTGDQLEISYMAQ